MYTLSKPAFVIADVLDKCIAATDETGLATRLTSSRNAIEANELLYDTRAGASQLDLMARIAKLGTITKQELKDLYGTHLSATNGAARAYYNAIRNAAANNLCPLCSIGSVAHIDHHLPKSKYPDLSVLPLNLVPACHFCNDTKKARFPKSAGEQTFHPYYDDHLLDDQWITATLDYGTPLVVRFSVSAPTSWGTIDRQRVARHFKICGLATSFGTSANAGLVALKRRLRRLHKKGGPEAVQDHLDEERDCFDDKPNSWQHVLFQALAADHWFVHGGFEQIADPKAHPMP